MVRRLTASLPWRRLPYSEGVIQLGAWCGRWVLCRMSQAPGRSELVADSKSWSQTTSSFMVRMNRSTTALTRRVAHRQRREGLCRSASAGNAPNSRRP